MANRTKAEFKASLIAKLDAKVDAAFEAGWKEFIKSGRTRLGSAADLGRQYEGYRDHRNARQVARRRIKYRSQQGCEMPIIDSKKVSYKYPEG